MGAQKCTVKGPAAAAANVLSTCVRAHVCVRVCVNVCVSVCVFV